jgi:hypothetical protein
MIGKWFRRKWRLARQLETKGALCFPCHMDLVDTILLSKGHNIFEANQLRTRSPVVFTNEACCECGR